MVQPERSGLRIHIVHEGYNPRMSLSSIQVVDSDRGDPFRRGIRF
jgi:hypothetical protein